MDYRELLKKYINLVEYNEGTDFINPFYWSDLKDKFDISIEDWKELYNLSDEIKEEIYNKEHNAKFQTR